MKLIALIIVAAVTAQAETFTLTSGVTVTGNVVSSMVAQVVIKTPLGATRQMPLSAFCIESLQRMPHDDGNVYAQHARLLEQYESLKRSSDKLKHATEKNLKDSAELVMLFDQLREEARLWKEASAFSTFDNEARIRHVKVGIDEFKKRQTKIVY